MPLIRAEIRQMAGELLVCGFAGTQVEAETREIVRELKPLGLIVFARNVEGARGLCELTAELKSLVTAEPLLLSIDQEGGRVARVREDVTVWPPMAALGRAYEAALARGEEERASTTRLAFDVGQALAREVRALGFDWNFAPVLDVDTNPQNPVIGDRALAMAAPAAAELGAAMVRGLQEAGVAACGKHFPGHGDSHEDSHLTLPTVDHPLERLQAVEFRPFASAIAAHVATIMTAHMRVPTLDEVPATLSKRTLTHVLRGQLGFRGAIVSDDIDMKGLADHYQAEEMGPLGLAAGVDIFLACKDPVAMFALYGGIVRAAESGRLDHARLASAANYARALRGKFARAAHRPAAAMLALQQARDDHRALAEKLHAIWQAPRAH